MLRTTIEEFFKDTQHYLYWLAEGPEPLIVRGRTDDVVVMSMDEYRALRATQHEMSSDKNAERLDRAIDKMEKGGSFAKDLLDD